MMQIVYFSEKNQLLSHLASLPGEILLITPSPAKADILRQQVINSNVHDVVTIARFTGDLLNDLWPEVERPVVKRKSELLLIFGILKDKYFPELGYEQFTQAYNLFSDLRSFSMDEGALSSILEEQPAEIRQAVSLFWKLLAVTGYLDEHGAYHALAERLRNIEELPHLRKTYVLWGFRHLNGQQVDLFKALAINYQVLIPLPESIKSKFKRSDWPMWLIDHQVEQSTLASINKKLSGSWIPVNSREMALNLRRQMSDTDRVIMGVARLDPSHIDIIPRAGVAFKIPHQLIQSEIGQLFFELNQPENNISDIECLRIWLQEKQQGLFASAGTMMPFKMLKAIQLTEEALAEIAGLTDEVPKVDRFFKKLLQEVVELNQPRTSWFPLLHETARVELMDMGALEEIRQNEKVILCIDERFQEIISLGQNYPESIQKELASLGPLKRNELELHFFHWEFCELFSRARVTVLMPEAILKHSLAWKKLFTGIELEKSLAEHVVSERELTDSLAVPVAQSYSGSFSASRLQTYRDCPRKFYYYHIEKLRPQLMLQRDIDPMTSGTIVHRIIEEYYRQSLGFDHIAALVDEQLGMVIAENKLRLPADVYLQRSLVFRHRATNGIKFLKQLEEQVKGPIQWKIEQDFELKEQSKIIGKIDCLGISSQYVFLLDFKSSKTAASSNSEVENFESLQLWVYAMAAQALVPEFQNKQMIIGYVVLDDPQESNLMLADTQLASSLRANQTCRPKIFGHDPATMLDEARKHIFELINVIKTDNRFASRPRKPAVCQFCELNQVCLKSELSHG